MLFDRFSMSKSLSHDVCYSENNCSCIYRKGERPHSTTSVRKRVDSMVMQPSQYAPGRPAQLKESHLRAVTGLTEEMAAYSSFGTLLATVRESAHLTQDEVAESLPPYFSMRNVPVIDNKMYGNLERGRRYPAFAELLPLYHALTEGCGIKFSQAERELYVVLARKKLAAKKRRIERISAEQC